MKKKEDIIFKNNIQNNFLGNRIYLKKKKNFNDIFNKIYEEINIKKNNYHVLSEEFELAFQTKDLKKFKKFKTIAIFGMGGSILGTEAIYRLFEYKIKKNFLFFDNLDNQKIKRFKKIVNFKNTLFIFVSKSGNTIETLTNINLILNSKINAKNSIIITEEKNNSLNKIAKKLNLFQVNHKNYIGGRYSVLSEVGMLPAYLMDLNIDRFKKNVFKIFNSKNKKFLCDSTLKMAHIYLKQKISNIIFFNCCPELNHFLLWCQQLLAESLGKKGRGLLPVISTAPKDYHSLLQLYLDGPKDKIFYIFSLSAEKNKNRLSKVTNAQKESFIKILKRKKIPFREFKFEKFNEEVLGVMFSYFILETAIIGNLLKINPFDQPAVEEIKILTKKNLD